MKRHLGIELFRIFVMLYIIAFHVSDHGTILIENMKTIDFNWIVLAIARLGGGIGNCAFVLITGYFLIDKQFDGKRIIKLWFQVLFYSVLLTTISFVNHFYPISFKHIVAMFMPFTFNEYWYFSSYIVLMLFLPFYNPLLQNFTKRQHQIFITVGLIIFSIIPTITKQHWMINWNFLNLFLFLYALGAYIKKYVQVQDKHYLVYGFCMMCISLIVMTVFQYLNIHTHRNFNTIAMAWPMSQLPVIITSTLLFLGFLSLNIEKGKNIILFFSTSVFGVYLAHIGRLQDYIFKVLFNTGNVYHQPWFIFWIIAVVLFIFIISTFIDKIRMYTVERWCAPIIQRSGDWVTRVMMKR